MSVQPSSGRPAPALRNEKPEDTVLIEPLLDRAFGPGRFVKASERVREIAEFAPDLSFCAWDEDRLLGVVRLWRVRVGGAPVAFLGPLAVDREQRSAGVGGMLVKRACDAAKAAGETAVLLVGDAPYFGRFEFSAEPARDVRLPGPVDQRRVLVHIIRAEGMRLAGEVTAP